jgi:hypothetical protein
LLFGAADIHRVGGGVRNIFGANHFDLGEVLRPGAQRGAFGGQRSDHHP